MKKFRLALQVVLFAVLAMGMAGCSRSCSEEEHEIRYEFGLPIDSFRVDTGYVQEGETLGGILNRKGATRTQQNQVSLLPRTEFDVRQLRPGKEYFCLYQTDSVGEEHLCYFVYIPSVRLSEVLHLSDSVHVEHQEQPTRIEQRSAEVVITSSLWNAMTSNHLPVELALELSEIYAWTIDFFGLQEGDSIRVYYDQMFVDTISMGIGRIYAANFYHGKQWQEAFYFENAEIHTYFDGDGKSLKKAFLKAPLNYKRISSHFTYARKHPIFKTVRPHTGVDYAAPAGTPVVSIGDGTVIEKGYKGGGGNTVKIRHNSTYTTAYLHLSKYGKGIAVGSRVSQGQVIGYVGSTGNSTGPHLDFRIWKNGTPVDPLKLISLPADPLPNKYRPEFDSIVHVMRGKLNSK
ncbi:MAG: M23 family metallopeptidase [Paludibacteraceae bacterium]|nr:M23 family metallopeptidase [Paludibacteraceae bacterium]